ncbi:MAG: SPFH domain-containing protein [Planctomycetota bacterium]|jgi:regulator of protease activity HflC (stomatin/prohibitin superfamily)
MINTKRIAGAGSVFAVIVLLIVIASCTEIVPVDKIGVKSNLLGQGIIKEDVKPGLCLIVPGMHKLELLDPTIQMISFSGKNSFPLTASDQFTTLLDISIFYRIEEKFAWNVYQNIGGKDSIRQLFTDKAREAIFRVMGQMRTEDLYNSEKRLDSSAKTLDALNDALKESHLRAESLLIRKVDFQKKFEDRLIAKQLLGQKQLLFKSKEKREKEQAKTQMIERDTMFVVKQIQEEMNKEIVSLKASNKAEIARIRADSEFKAKQMIAEADRMRRERIAEGEKLKAIAKAKGQKAVNDAYRSNGGKLLLTRKMVDNLDFGSIEINTNNMNPFDVNHFLNLLGANNKK